MDFPIPTFKYLISALRSKFPSLAYLHLVEPRISGDGDAVNPNSQDSNDFAIKAWGVGEPGREANAYFSAGGYNATTAVKTADELDVAIVMGRYFISNVSPIVVPCLVSRLHFPH